MTREEKTRFQPNALHMVDPMTREAMALTRRAGERMRNTYYTTLYENGVAVLDISGPIFRRADTMETSGAMSTEEVFHELRAIRASQNVKAAIINMDTPGGDVTSADVVAQFIHDLAKEKPVETYIEGYGASLGYYWASATRRITQGRHALSGSIGVVLGIPVPAGKTEFGDNVLLDPDGTAVVEMVSSQSPLKRADPTTKEGHEYFRAMVDGLADEFVADVARFRGLDASLVPAQYGEGGVYRGRQALEMGLCDEVGTFEQVLERMISADWERGSSMVGPSGPTPEPPTDGPDDVPGPDVVPPQAEQQSEAHSEGEADMGLRDHLPKALGGTGKPTKPSASANGGGAATTLPINEVLAHLNERRMGLIEQYGPECAALALAAVADGAITPAEQDDYAARRVNAMVDDALYGGEAVYFDPQTGEELYGTRLEAFETGVITRPKQSLAEERVSALVSGRVTGTALAASEPDTATVIEPGEHGDPSITKEQALAASSGGRAVLEQKNGNRK